MPCDRAKLEVAAGVLRDEAGRVLVSRRPEGRDLAGRWEFPGGKIDPGETAEDALRRELAEELDIRIGRHRPLVSVRHKYRDKIVRLRLFEIHSFDGTARGVEGQLLRWVETDELRSLDMPPADRALIRLLDLDSHYSISPPPSSYASVSAFVDAWRGCLESGFHLIRLRPAPGERVPAELVEAIDRMTRAYGARWIASGELAQCYGWPVRPTRTGAVLRLARARPAYQYRPVGAPGPTTVAGRSAGNRLLPRPRGNADCRVAGG